MNIQIKATFLVAVDPRIKAAVLGLVGGDLPYILAYSKEGAWHHRGLSRRREAYLSEHHLTREQFRHQLEEEVVWDPNAVARGIDPGKVLMIIGLCDTVVPTRTGMELRRLMHKPETLFVVSDHYSAYFYLPRIKSQALRFFNKRLQRSLKLPQPDRRAGESVMASYQGILFRHLSLQLTSGPLKSAP
jgi:hypothetical protein